VLRGVYWSVLGRVLRFSRRLLVCLIVVLVFGCLVYVLWLSTVVTATCSCPGMWRGAWTAL
jgi:hypothetical protein